MKKSWTNIIFKKKEKKKKRKKITIIEVGRSQRAISLHSSLE